jgi:hypothetical protein
VNISSTPITNYLPGFYGSTVPPGDFGEAAINLSTVLGDLNNGDKCGAFASAWMHSRSSSSSTSSQLQDYVAPTAFVVNTCKAPPSLSTVPSGLVKRGAPKTQRARRYALCAATAISDTAHLTGGNNPTGTITFRLYGPSDSTCTGSPVFSSSATVMGDGYYQSGSYVPTSIGTYRWVVKYSGDPNNNPAGPTGCGSETVTVVKAVRR